MPIRTSRATAPSVLRRVAGLIVIVCALTIHLSAHASDMPERGMTRSAVERAFGAPEQKRAPVGQPPISRWVYADFTVYFEGDYALHAVSHRPPPAPARAPDVVSSPTSAAPDAADTAPESRSEYRFDPATGQIIPLDDTASPAAAAPVERPPVEQEIQPEEPAPVTEPAPADTDTAPAADSDASSGKRPARFRFDPASGRIIMDDGQPPATANPGSTGTAADTGAEPGVPEEAAPQPAPAADPAPAEPQDAPATPAADTGGGFRMQW